MDSVASWSKNLAHLIVSGVDTVLIPFVGRIRDVEKSMSVDLEELRKSLIRILKELNLPLHRLGLGEIAMSPANAIEIFYLTYRPGFGGKLRNLCRRFGRGR